MTQWGATSSHMRMGVDVSMSPATVTADTASVTLTWTIKAQTVNWYWHEGQTATLSGAVSATKSYRKDDPQTSGTYDTVVGSWTSTVAPSASAPITRQLNVAGSGNSSGAKFSVSASFTVPQRPASTSNMPSPGGDEGSTPTTPVPATDGSGSLENPPPPETPTDTPAEIPPPSSTVSTQMDLIPAVGSLVWSSGDYDAFPQTAAHGDTVLVAWRHAIDHAVDRNATLMAAVSKDGGRTYATPWTLPIAKVANSEPSVGGLAWDAQHSQWVLVVSWRRYADSTGSKVAARWTEYMTSKDDGQTWTSPAKLDASAASWFYMNDLAIRDGLWIAGGYGVMAGQPDSIWQCLTMTSTDAGATWSAPKPVAGTPADSSWAEPNIVFLPGVGGTGAWLMTMRAVGPTEIHRAISINGVDWAYAGLAVAGYTGNPDVLVTPDGTLLLLARTADEPYTGGPGYALGRWSWGYSFDNGQSWSMVDNLGGVTGRNVYGSMANTSSGVAVAFAAEDDPDKPWGGAAVWYTRFVTQQLVLAQGFVGPVATFDVSTADRIPVTRVWTDRWTGEEMRDQVRWRTLDGFTSRDFEVQQGQVVTYRAGNRVTGMVAGPILPHIILVHPLYPELSVPIEVSTDSDRAYKLDAQVTEIPSSPYAIVTKSGARKVRSPYGETKFRTKTLEDKDRVLRLFEDGTPLFVSAHPGADFPDWVQPLEELGEGRAVQTCGHPDHGNELGEWRDWSFKWVAVRRPTALGLPVRRRIEELEQTIQSIMRPIQEI